MTSREFIQRHFGIADGKRRANSSVYKDQRGNIYSYGHHYPLLFKVKGLTFRNCGGYSNTTNRHISWAGGIDPLAIDVWISGTNYYTWHNRENAEKVPALLNTLAWYAVTEDEVEKLEDKILRAVFADLEAELVDINQRIASKKRTDTKLYAALLEERADCTDRIASVRPYLTV